jgi:hypothetical protein
MAPSYRLQFALIGLWIATFLAIAVPVLRYPTMFAFAALLAQGVMLAFEGVEGRQRRMRERQEREIRRRAYQERRLEELARQREELALRRERAAMIERLQRIPAPDPLEYPVWFARAYRADLEHYERAQVALAGPAQFAADQLRRLAALDEERRARHADLLAYGDDGESRRPSLLASG